MYHICLIHSSFSSRFHFLTIVTRMAMSAAQQMTAKQDTDSFDHIPSRLAGSYGNIHFYVFEYFSYWFPEWRQQFSFPSTVNECSSSPVTLFVFVVIPSGYIYVTAPTSMTQGMLQKRDQKDCRSQNIRKSARKMSLLELSV